jgi:hypothetical protein
MYEVAEIQDAQVLAPLLGTKWAPILFGSIDSSCRTKRYNTDSQIMAILI